MKHYSLPKSRTITLTNQAPVRIIEDEWPIIAHGSAYESDDFASNGVSNNIDIRVRKHRDGRCIVYGTYTPANLDTTIRVGRLVAIGNPDKLAIEIRAVGDEMIDLAALSTGSIKAVVSSCIADLPAKSL